MITESITQTNGLIVIVVMMRSLSSLRYLLYWKGRLMEQPVTEFCSVIKTNSTGPAGAFTDSQANTYKLRSESRHLT